MIDYSPFGNTLEKSNENWLSVDLEKGYSALEQGEGCSGKWAANVDFAEI